MRSTMYRTGSAGVLTAVLLVGAFMHSTAVAAPAGMVTTQQLAQQSRADQQRAQVNAFLERAEVKAQLEARGVNAADAAVRISGLNASELATLAAQIDTLPAGEGALETLVFVLVIFMLLDIAGVTDIFPGV